MKPDSRLSKLWHWLLGPGPALPRAAEAMELLGSARVPSSLGETLMAETPGRDRFRASIRDLIGDLGRAEKRELVDRVLLRFALWVMDLPASEAHHDSAPGGHLDHALKVTHSVVQALSNSTLRLSYDPVEDARERPRWIYAGFLAALFHDAGKLYDVEVSSPDRREQWNPEEEPLAGFLGRHGLRRTPRDLCRFLPGRGLKAHKLKGRVFPPLILPAQAAKYVGRRLIFITDCYAEASFGELPPHLPEAARMIAALIRAWDKEESMLSQAEARKDAPAPPKEKGAAISEAPRAIADGKPGIQAPSAAAQSGGKAAPLPPASAPETPLPDQGAPRPPLAIPGAEVWGPSPQGLVGDLTVERILYVLGRAIQTGRLQAQGESAKVFIRPDYVWYVSPVALEQVASSEKFKWRSDLNLKMLVALARAGVLKPFGPERYVAQVRTSPSAKHTRKAFRVLTSAVLGEPRRSDLEFWPCEIEVVQTLEEASSAGEPAA